jgi:ABC-type transport system substrate-binding protein
MARIGLGFVLLLVLLATACRSGVPAPVGEPRPVGGGRLRMPLAGDPASITPLGARTLDELTVARELFAGLVDIDPSTGAIVPVIARSWTRSADLRTFTFRLRNDVRFSDGTPITARTFADDWTTVCQSGAPAADLLASIEGGSGCGHAGWSAPLRGVRATSPLRLEIHLSAPFADFASVLANPGTWAFPPDRAATPAGRRAFEQAPVGAGPFALRSWTPGRRIELTANPRAVVRPHLDGVTFLLLPKPDGARAAMRGFARGLVDVAEVPPVQAQVTMADPRLSKRLLVQPTESATIVLVHPSASLDAAERRALAYGTDAQSVATSVMGGVSTVADGLVPAGTPASPPGVWPYDYDAGAARHLLQGLPAVRLRLGAGPGSEDAVATLVAGYRDAGIDATAGGRSAQVTVARIFARYPGPDGMLAQLAGPAGRPLIQRARATADADRRAALYAAAERAILDPGTVIPVTFDGRAFVVSARVTRFQIDPLGLPHLELCRLTRQGEGGP